MENDAIGSDAYLGDNGALQDGWMDNMPDGTFEKDDTGANKVGDLADHKDIAGVVKSYLSNRRLPEPLQSDTPLLHTW